MATGGQFYWPSVGIFVAAYGQFFMAANRLLSWLGPSPARKLSKHVFYFLGLGRAKTFAEKREAACHTTQTAQR
ncbi:hypothetical protein BWQ92_01045 [Arthrobacter sp. QXT-31]|nr:hypothetical protein BWQ92_01045 [Arthrobacter sp. QXT-31]